jgi:asparagine synthase (glutamine-hydrolysing)
MSAIVGIYHYHDEPVSEEHSAGLMKALEQFPANDIQTWQNRNIFLGCHAQWITPESIGEKLPYYDYGRRLAITADAIIDNREELFAKLQIQKHKQKTISDSELILLAYDKWREDCPKHLIGDFAFMIWDEKRQRLFGARDFSGARTLYYYVNEQRFSFCTIMEPMFTLPYINQKLNELWVAHFLAITASVDTADSSITPYRDIQQIPPSHSITVTSKGIKLTRYCTLKFGEYIKLKNTDEYVEAFQSVFQGAVNSLMRTYRGVGSHLSGGLDSGSVVSFAARELKRKNKTLHTFSYIPAKDFVDYTPSYLMPDETPFIKKTVNYVGGIKDHYLDLEGRSSYKDIDDFLEILEMPYKFFENSFWIKGIFEKASTEGIGVVLNGGRGNLGISWGHSADYFAQLLKKFQWLRLYTELSQYCKYTGGPRLKNLRIITKVAYPFLERNSAANSNAFSMLINPELAKRTRVFDQLKNHGIDETGWFSSKDMFELRKRHFQEVFNWNATNTLVTKLSLRYGVWERDPTNDLRVIRFCLSVPENQYVQNGQNRALIRNSTKNLLPDDIRLNYRVRGVQGADWLHRMGSDWDSFKKEIYQLREDNKVMDYLNFEAIQSAILKVEEGFKPENATNAHLRTLMRSIILNRFLKKFS